MKGKSIRSNFSNTDLTASGVLVVARDQTQRKLNINGTSKEVERM